MGNSISEKKTRRPANFVFNTRPMFPEIRGPADCPCPQGVLYAAINFQALATFLACGGAKRCPPKNMKARKSRQRLGAVRLDFGSILFFQDAEKRTAKRQKRTPMDPCKLSSPSVGNHPALRPLVWRAKFIAAYSTPCEQGQLKIASPSIF